MKLEFIEERRGWKLVVEEGDNIINKEIALPAFFCPDIQAMLSPEEDKQWKFCNNHKEDHHEHFNIIEMEDETRS